MFNVQCSMFNVKRKHCPCKPGSVPTLLSVPAIYLLRTSPCASSVLPSIAARPTRSQALGRATLGMSMVYMNLQPPAGTARRSPVGWWSLTHAFSPLPLQTFLHSTFNVQCSTFLRPFGSKRPEVERNVQCSTFNVKRRGGRSLLPLPAVANCFYFQKWSALCCPDFPPASPFWGNASGRAGAVLSCCKGTNKRAKSEGKMCFFRKKVLPLRPF